MSALLALVLTLVYDPAAHPAPPAPKQVKVVRVSASSALPEWNEYTFGATNLIDGRVDTSWQPAKSDTLGVGQWVELDLGEPHELSFIEIAQGLQKVDARLGDLFCRNNRFANVRIFFEDGTYAAYRADPAERMSRIEDFHRGEHLPENRVEKVVTRFIRLVVRSVHEPVDWKDLAIAEIRVFGRLAPAIPSHPESIGWDQAGVWPLKTAIIDACAAKAAKRGQLGCAALVRAISEGQASFETLPPVAVAALDKGEVVVSFVADEVRIRVELERGAVGRWSVKRVTRLDSLGKPAAPAQEYPPEADDQHQNDCWEKLGKVRPCDESGEHVSD